MLRDVRGLVRSQKADAQGAGSAAAAGDAGAMWAREVGYAASVVLVALLEDLPMAVLNVVILVRDTGSAGLSVLDTWLLN